MQISVRLLQAPILDSRDVRFEQFVDTIKVVYYGQRIIKMQFCRTTSPPAVVMQKVHIQWQEDEGLTCWLVGYGYSCDCTGTTKLDCIDRETGEENG